MKPTTVYTRDNTEYPFKEICVHYHAKYCWIDKVKFRLPEWRTSNEKSHPTDTN
jgi:hypothetical protein